MNAPTVLMKYWKGLVRFGKDEGPPSQGNEMHVNEMRYGHRVHTRITPRQATRGTVHAIVLKMRCRLQRTAGLGGWSDEKNNLPRRVECRLAGRGATCADLACATARNRADNSILEI